MTLRIRTNYRVDSVSLEVVQMTVSMSTKQDRERVGSRTAPRFVSLLVGNLIGVALAALWWAVRPEFRSPIWMGAYPLFALGAAVGVIFTAAEYSFLRRVAPRFPRMWVQVLIVLAASPLVGIFVAAVYYFAVPTSQSMGDGLWAVAALAGLTAFAAAAFCAVVGRVLAGFFDKHRASAWVLFGCAALYLLTVPFFVYR